MAWVFTKAGSIVTLDPRQGQGARLVRQYLEKNGEDPIFLSHYFLPKSIWKLTIPHTPEHSVNCQCLFFIDHWEIMFTITERTLLFNTVNLALLLKK